MNIKTFAPIIAAFALASCDQPKVNIPPAPTEMPKQSQNVPPSSPRQEPLDPKVAATPVPTPTPQARLAPEGTFYVIEKFSVNTPEGVHGFAKGKKVTLVRDEGDFIVVSDGATEGRAPKGSITNDMDIIDSLNAGIAATSTQSQAQYAQKQAEIKKIQQETDIERKKEVQRQKLNACAARILTLQKEADDLRKYLQLAKRRDIEEGSKKNSISSVGKMDSPENRARQARLEQIQSSINSEQQLKQSLEIH